MSPKDKLILEIASVNPEISMSGMRYRQLKRETVDRLTIIRDITVRYKGEYTPVQTIKEYHDRSLKSQIKWWKGGENNPHPGPLVLRGSRHHSKMHNTHCSTMRSRYHYTITLAIFEKMFRAGQICHTCMVSKDRWKIIMENERNAEITREEAQ